MNQVLTIYCKLKVSESQAAKLDATLDAFEQALNWVNQNFPPFYCSQKAESTTFQNGTQTQQQLGVLPTETVYRLQSLEGWGEGDFGEPGLYEPDLSPMPAHPSRPGSVLSERQAV